jgi:hypothetical protein
MVPGEARTYFVLTVERLSRLSRVPRRRSPGDYRAGDMPAAEVGFPILAFRDWLD